MAIIATWHFFRAGYFSWRIFWPFAVGSIPFAFIGGALSLPGPVYKKVLGLILLFAAYRLFHIWSNRCGRLFLSPLLLFMGWAKTKQTAGVSAAFIHGGNNWLRSGQPAICKCNHLSSACSCPCNCWRKAHVCLLIASKYNKPPVSFLVLSYV